MSNWTKLRYRWNVILCGLLFFLAGVNTSFFGAALIEGNYLNAALNAAVVAMLMIAGRGTLEVATRLQYELKLEGRCLT